MQLQHDKLQRPKYNEVKKNKYFNVKISRKESWKIALMTFSLKISLAMHSLLLQLKEKKNFSLRGKKESSIMKRMYNKWFESFFFLAECPQFCAPIYSSFSPHVQFTCYEKRDLLQLVIRLSLSLHNLNFIPSHSFHWIMKVLIKKFQCSHLTFDILFCFFLHMAFHDGKL